jgi:hypothetical protein
VPALHGTRRPHQLDPGQPWNPDSDQAHGLVAWWPMLPPLRNTAWDWFGAHPGTFQGGLGWTADPFFGLVPSLDASDDYIDAGTSGRFDFGTGDFTLVAWAQTGATGNRFLIDKTIVASPYTGYVLEMDNNHARLQVNDGSNFSLLEGSVTINDGKPHLLVATRSGATGKVYVDGVLDASGTVQSGSVTTTANLSLGRYQHGGAEFVWSGPLAEVRLYQVALTADRVAALWHPRTRWELYRPPRRPSYFVPAATESKSGADSAAAAEAATVNANPSAGDTAAGGETGTLNLPVDDAAMAEAGTGLSVSLSAPEALVVADAGVVTVLGGAVRMIHLTGSVGTGIGLTGSAGTAVNLTGSV